MEKQTTSKSFEVIVLAAGKGTRMRSRLPKVLHKVCGRSLLERALRAAASLGPRRIVSVIGYGEAMVRSELERLASFPEFKGIELAAVVQEPQLGTGHAAQFGLGAVSADAEEVMILPGDSPLLDRESLVPFLEHFRAENAALSFLTVALDDPAAFGRVVRGNGGAVERVVELKDCTPEQVAINEINASIYLARREFLAGALGGLTPNNAQKEYYLTDIIEHGVRQGDRVAAFLSEHREATMGANSRAELSRLEAYRRARIIEEHQERGVTFEDPNAAYVDEGVLIGADTYIGAGVRLLGATVLGEGVVIEGDSLLRDVTVGDETLIRLGCYLQEARIASSCAIGPFAHLRPGSVLEAQVKVGNFVETKQAHLKRGVKANHLTYLGDAVVGEDSNVGAGTITCNYDGEKKHRTVIGAKCFIGSNTALVAPVELGDQAYVGAGSTITADVPAGALAVGRARQRTIDEWITRKKRAQPEK